MRYGGVHIREGRIGPRRRDERKRRRPLVGELLLEFPLHVQRLRTGDLEAATGEVTGLGQSPRYTAGARRSSQTTNTGPAESAQATAHAHHELLDGFSRFLPGPGYVA